MILDASLLEADQKGVSQGRGNRQDLAYQIAFVRVFGQRSRQEPMKTEWSGFSKALRKDSIGTVLLMAQVHGCLRDERVNVHFYTNCVGTPSLLITYFKRWIETVWPLIVTSFRVGEKDTVSN